VKSSLNKKMATFELSKIVTGEQVPSVQKLMTGEHALLNTNCDDVKKVPAFTPPFMRKYFTKELMEKCGIVEMMQKVLDTQCVDDESWE